MANSSDFLCAAKKPQGGQRAPRVALLAGQPEARQRDAGDLRDEVGGLGHPLAALAQSTTSATTAAASWGTGARPRPRRSTSPARRGCGRRPDARRGPRPARVVADEPREAAFRARRVQERQRQLGFAGARRAPDQDRGFADRDAAGVQRPRLPRPRSCPRPSGARGGRRGAERRQRHGEAAPMRVGSPSGPGGPARFAAVIAPPCASTIWREIDRPRPEFWPKPCSGRSV